MTTLEKISRMRLRSAMLLSIIVLGVLACLLATGAIYYQHQRSLATQEAQLGRTIAITAEEHLGNSEAIAGDLGISLQHDPAFRAAVAKGDPRHISAHLNHQFHQYFVTANLIRLVRLAYYDANLNLVATSTEGPGANAPFRPMCRSLISTVMARHGADRLRRATELCADDGQPRHVVLVPSGGLRVTGFIEVAIDPAYCLRSLATVMKSPVEILAPSGAVLSRSEDWEETARRDGTISASWTAKELNGERAFSVQASHFPEQFHADFKRTQYLVLVSVLAVVIVAALVAFSILKRWVLNPLRVMVSAFGTTHDGSRAPTRLGLRGPAEIRQLTEDFNNTSRELHEARAKLECMAYTDALTNLPNRAHFQKALDSHIQLSARAPRPFAVLLMDLDGFKGINDTLGHHAGDWLLREVAVRLKGVLRASDLVARLATEAPCDPSRTRLVARLGGDEFSAILPDVRDTADAVAIGRKIVEAVLQPLAFDGQPIRIGVSVGIACFPEHGRDANGLLRQADAAMYRAKTGRLGVALCDVPLSDASSTPDDASNLAAARLRSAPSPEKPHNKLH